MNLRAKKVILTLLNKINDEKKRVYEAFKREEGMKMKIKFVKSVSFYTLVKSFILLIAFVALTIMK